MALPEHAREPCPDRILDDVGGAFGMGAVGGSFLHFLKGAYNSPHGDRLVGGFQTSAMNAGRIGGNFAVWGGLFSTFDCVLVYARQKEDPWNSIAAGAATGGFLSLRGGLRAASRSAVFGGVILALIEGAVIMMNRLPGLPAPPLESPPPSASPSPSASHQPIEEPAKSWLGFGGFFGSKEPESSATSSLPRSEILDTFPTTTSSSSSSSYPSADGKGLLGILGSDKTFQTRPPSPPPTPEVVAPPLSKSGWFGSFFGKEKQKEPEKQQQSGVLDSFDANPAPPVPSFEIK